MKTKCSVLVSYSPILKGAVERSQRKKNLGLESKKRTKKKVSSTLSHL